MKIGVVNESTLCGKEEASLMVDACSLQMKDVADAWGKTAPVVEIFANAKDVPSEYEFVVIVDDADQAGALGYHAESPDGRYFSRVFCRPTVKSGGTMLNGDFSVSSVLSHELIEMFVDPAVNVWVDGVGVPEGSCYALEACDPVESDSYTVSVSSQIGTVTVSVSNFILPAWFDAAEVTKCVDHMGKCPGPFALAPGGYCVVRQTPGSERQIFAALPPSQLRMAAKLHSSARTCRRLSCQS